MKESYWKDKGIYYRTSEFKKERLTLIFIHGLTGSSSSWSSYEKIFEKKYNLLTFDIRGHGKSKKPSSYSNYEMKHFASDIHDLVLYLNISKFILISHSMGTLIALEYIKLYREDVLANILFSPVLGMEKDFSGKILRPILALSKIFSLFPFKPKPGIHINYNKFLNTTDWDIKRIYTDSRNTTLRIHLYCLRQTMILEQEYFLEQIKIPTLIVHGIKDTMASVKNSIILSKKIKNSEIILMPNSGHFFVLNNVKEMSQFIELFIEKHLLKK
jgi:pimeloyl-ACP methyl ester carboxylesterase